MLQRLGEAMAFFRCHLMDGFFSVEIRGVDEHGNQPVRQQVDERVLDLLALIFLEIAQDARRELFRREQA